MSNKIFTVAHYTFKELIKSKIMASTIWIALSLFIITYITSEFSYGNTKLIAIDVGMGASSIVSVIMAILMGVNVINNEIESRTIYISLSRPISRKNFFIGKILGMSLILSLNILIINIFTLFVYFMYGGEWSSLILWSIGFMILECLIVLLISIDLSFFTNRAITIMNSIVIFFVGHGLAGISESLFVKKRALLKITLSFLSWIIPSFDRINVKAFILTGQVLKDKFLYTGLLYACTYLFLLLFIGIYIFKQQELE